MRQFGHVQSEGDSKIDPEHAREITQLVMPQNPPGRAGGSGQGDSGLGFPVENAPPTTWAWITQKKTKATFGWCAICISLQGFFMLEGTCKSPKQRFVEPVQKVRTARIS